MNTIVQPDRCNVSICRDWVFCLRILHQVRRSSGQQSGGIDASGKSQIVNYFAPFTIDVGIRGMCPVCQFKSEPDIFRGSAQPDVCLPRVLSHAHMVTLLNRVQGLLVHKRGGHSVQG